MKVVHMTSGHPPFDTRIFRKECRSLAAAGLQVILIAPHTANEVVDGVEIRAIQKPQGRLERFTRGPKRVLEVALTIDADIYHFHDPELWSVGMKLAKLGKTVVYDAHENVPSDILNRDYIPLILRGIISKAAERKEMEVTRAVAGIVTVTEGIAARFPREKTILARNYPVLEDMDVPELPYTERRNQVVFSGGISRERQAESMVSAIGLVESDANLLVVGPKESDELVTKLSALKGCSRTQYLGSVKQQDYYQQLFNSKIGLSLVEARSDYGDVSTNKVYEYMYASVPMIVSPISAWVELVQRFQCGLIAEDNAPDTIAKHIEYLLSNPDVASEMGRRGREAVIEHYSWAKEAQGLVDFYDRIVKR